MSCGEPEWVSKLSMTTPSIGVKTTYDPNDPVGTEYEWNARIDNISKEYVDGVGESGAQPEYHLELSDEGITWYMLDGNSVKVIDEITELRKEVDMLKTVIDQISGAYKIKDFQFNSVSLVKSDEYPIDNMKQFNDYFGTISEEDRFEAAMKGV